MNRLFNLKPMQCNGSASALHIFWYIGWNPHTKIRMHVTTRRFELQLKIYHNDCWSETEISLEFWREKHVFSLWPLSFCVQPINMPKWLPQPWRLRTAIKMLGRMKIIFLYEQAWLGAQFSASTPHVSYNFSFTTLCVELSWHEHSFHLLKLQKKVLNVFTNNQHLVKTKDHNYSTKNTFVIFKHFDTTRNHTVED